MFSFIDLFAGIGGFRQALESLGGKCIGFSEIATDAINVYCTNYKESKSLNFGDITKIKKLPSHDFLTAGVPCQSWSIAGKNLGFDDDRGQLWNDTLFLLNNSRPKAFIFENVKGLADPRNERALIYILTRIKEAGYYAHRFVLNSYDYGVPQNRVRIYIIGFKEKQYYDAFKLPKKQSGCVRLRDVIDGCASNAAKKETNTSRWSLSCNEEGLNDYFLFNDLRNGHSTIHSWDIQETSEKEKKICLLILANRRKKIYGPLDGNPLSLNQIHHLDSSVTEEDVKRLVEIGILKEVKYRFRLSGIPEDANDAQKIVYSLKGVNDIINVDEAKTEKILKIKKISLMETLNGLTDMGFAECVETRYDFKNTKISTGLNGINRIFLPSSNIFPTLVASDSNDFITTQDITADSPEEYKEKFLKEVYTRGLFRKITKEEACKIQGFPSDFILPDSRTRWMKLIGNSVSVPVIRMLAAAVINTGVFGNIDSLGEFEFEEKEHPLPKTQLSLFDSDDFN